SLHYALPILRPPEQPLRVEDGEVCPRSEVIAPGEVAPGIRHRHALGEAARLEDPVVGARVAEGSVPGAVQEPELREQRADPAGGILAPAALPLVARPEVIIPHAVTCAGARLQLVA